MQINMHRKRKFGASTEIEDADISPKSEETENELEETENGYVKQRFE